MPPSKPQDARVPAAVRDAAIEKDLTYARAELAMEAAGIGCWETDPATGEAIFDERAREIFGLPAGAALDTEQFLSLLAEDDRDRVRGLIDQAFDPAGSGGYRAEYRVTGRADGRLRWISAIGKVLFDREAPRRMIGTVMDITEPRLAEEKLHESEALRILAMDAAKIGAWETDLATLALKGDLRAMSLLGHPGEAEIDFATWLACMHPDDRARVVETVAAAQKTPEVDTFELETRLIHPHDGRETWVAGTGKVFFEKGRAVRMLGTIADVTERRRAEAALHESEARRTLAMEAADIGAWELDLPTGILHADIRAWRSAGADEARGIPIADWLMLLHPDDRPGLEAAMTAALDPAGPGGYDREVRVTGPGDLPERWLAIRARAFFEEGKAVRFLGTSMNVTQRKHAEAALRESEARRALAMEAADIGSWELDARTGILSGDARTQRLTGAPQETMPLAEWFARVHPEDLAHAEAKLAQALDPTGDGYLDIEERAILPGGLPEQWLSIRGKAVFEGGQATRVFGTVANVTERRRAETALRESEARRNLAMEAADIGAWDIDPRTGILKGDARAWRLVVVDEHPEGMPLEQWMTLVHPDDLARVEEGVAKALDPTGDGSYDQEYRVIVPGPAEVWLAIKGKAFFEDGEAVRFLGTTMNVTERKRVELHRELLVNELNHRVKNSLATTQAIAMLTLLADEDPERAKASFIARIGALARAHDVLTRRNWEGADLAEVVENALTPFASSRVSVDGPRVRLWPKAALALSSSLFELATNAARHGALSSETGKVAIAWSLVEDDFRLSWRECGGPPVTAPRRRGFGSRLIQQGLAGELGAKVDLDFAPKGLIFTMSASRIDLQGPDA